MRILVSHAGQQLGPFSLDELRREFAAGRVMMSDLAWWEGQPAWVPVSQVPGLSQPAPPPYAASSAPAAYPGPVRVDDGSGLAIGSLVLGLVSIIGGACFTGLGAIICGHMALSRQKRAGATNSKGLAIVGLVLGYGITVLSILGVAFFAIFAIPAMRGVGDQVKLVNSVSHARTLAFACKVYAIDHDDEYPPSLEALVPEHLPEVSDLEDPLAPQFGRDGFYYLRPAKTDPESTVIIAGHGTAGGKRAVARKNGEASAEKWNPPADL
jgi:hypothetical protein